jgi:hypothetical protein
MRLAFRFVAAFNVATAVWLTVMFFVLRHPGYAPRAGATAGIAAFCALAFLSAGTARAGWMRATSVGGSLVLAAMGAWFMYQDTRPGADFEGFVLIVGLAWIAQGVAAAVTFRPAVTGSGAA